MNPLIRTARWTGAAYLGLALAGLLGFIVIRSRLYVPDDPVATLTNLVEQELLAQTRIAMEVLVVVTQSLAAVGFYALFRRDHPTAAYGVATFGTANAIAVLGSAAMLTTAREVAVEPAAVADPAGTVDLLYAISEGFWNAGAVFFGLWLIPMGWYAISTNRMPPVLGWLLVAGGGGYVLSALVLTAAPAAPGIVADILTLPATIGELWMIGYLLIRGIRPPATPTDSTTGPPQHRPA